MNLLHFYASLSASLFSFSFDFSLLSDSVFWRLESGSGSLAVSLFFLFVSAAASFLPFCSFLNTFKKLENKNTLIKKNA